MQFVLKNCKILHFVRGLYDKNSASQYSFSSDVVYKKNTRLVCTHPDLLARICKLVERQKVGLIYFPRICFPRLIYCDQEPLLLLNVTEDFLGGCTSKAISTRYKICFPPKSLSFSLKSHMNVPLS